MGVRAMWKANLVVGAKKTAPHLPVRLYAAVEDRGVHLHLLHREDGQRVRQRMAHPRTGRTVEAQELQRGVEVERGRFVVLDDEDLARLEPEASRDVRVERFVEPAAIDHRYYERPYYLGPDGQAGAYFALAAALQQTGREGLARWTMRKREYVGALRLHEGHLALVALRNADEVVAAGELQPPEGRALDERERKLAAQLVAALTGDFDHSQFRDEYRDRVLEIVAKKQRGERIEVPRHRARKTRDDSLVDVLQRSLKSAS